MVEKGKAEVDHDNQNGTGTFCSMKMFRTNLLNFFPERKIKTDYDAFELAKKLEDNVVDEIKKKLSD